jgi:hypothetical protein
LSLNVARKRDYRQRAGRAISRTSFITEVQSSTCPRCTRSFVGDWSSAANQNRATRLSQFVTDLLNSRYMNILSQYGCGTTGTLVNSVFIASGNNLSATDIHNILQTAINNNTIPEPTNPSNPYALFLDNATAVNDTTAGAVMCEATSDTAFGYHDFFTTSAGKLCYFSVVPGLTDMCLQNSCPGNDSGCSLHLGQTQEQRQTQVASHELSEMFSDPQVGSNEAWCSPGSPHEKGDICNGQTRTITVGAQQIALQKDDLSLLQGCRSFPRLRIVRARFVRADSSLTSHQSALGRKLVGWPFGPNAYKHRAPLLNLRLQCCLLCPW